MSGNKSTTPSATDKNTLIQQCLDLASNASKGGLQPEGSSSVATVSIRTKTVSPDLQLETASASVTVDISHEPPKSRSLDKTPESAT
jgi:hypothetical protein